jgi:hypothetical protein
MSFTTIVTIALSKMSGRLGQRRASGNLLVKRGDGTVQIVSKHTLYLLRK